MQSIDPTYPAMNFFIARDGTQYGPYPIESLAQMVREENVVPSDQMLVEGNSNWQSVADYLRAQSSAAPTAAVPPPLPRQQPPPLPASQRPPPIPAGGTIAAPPIVETELERAVLDGGRFVIFQYCFSVLVMTFKRPSSITFLRGDEDGFKDAFTHSLISLTVGWWGIPWGPIWTIGTVYKNVTGGVDVTNAVLTEKFGPIRAAQIMAKRRAPAPKGNAMKFFRWGLIGAPVALFLLLAIVPVFSGFENSSNYRSTRSTATSGFAAANREINTHHGSAAFGNSPKAVAAATSFSKQMKKMRDLLFEAGKKDGFSVSDHQFLTYCELHDSECAFIVHVPELRRFSKEAKESLGTLAWITAQSALKEQQITNSAMRLAVGLRGIVLYDRVLLGTLQGDIEAKNNTLTETVVGSNPEQRLSPFFEIPTRESAKLRTDVSPNAPTP